MSVIDFHSHVLPRIDDGSHSSEESLGMLQISASQGIDVMAATSHFYATEDRISSFLNRRRCSEERLKERMNQELTKEERIPRLIMGAEVAFFTGISRAERLEELTYEGTDLLLLEMPFTKWNKSEIEEVRYILERRKLRVMLAHLERFLMIPGNKKRIYELMELPVYVQINAGSFERWGERRQISKMIRKKEQIFLGVIGFSGGLVIAGGVIALMVGLGVITRFIGISHTAKHVRIFEDAILLGSVFGTLMTVYQPTIPLDAAGLAVLGLFSGIFVGGWILALAEIVNIFPILTRRIGLTKGLSLVVIAIALGKMSGSLIYFYFRW